MMSNLGGTNYSSRREDSEAVEGILDYAFKDKCLVLQALSLPGSSAYSTGNKGLAQVGDAAVRLHIISEGHQRGMSRGKYQMLQDTERRLMINERSNIRYSGPRL